MDTKRILVVDDDTMVCAVIRAVLEDEGFAVDAAIGASAIEKAKREPPDLILLDLVMPAPDGREIRRRLLDDPRTAAVPCVLMSSDDQVYRTARELHTQGCLPKPFEIDDLVEVVRRETHAA